MLFRSHRPETPTENRFGAPSDVFVSRREGELFVSEVSASEENAVEHFRSLIDEMPALVDFSMTCLRTKRHFVGEGLHRTEVSETVARLRVPLVASGGVELAVYTADEQLSLSPLLDVWIYAKSDRWVYLLLGLGLEETAELPRRTWTVAPSEFTGARTLVSAVSVAAERLTLKVV
jgi:hypothetical protein